MLTIKQRIKLGKLEILKDIAEGVVPTTVKNFRELHDFVDANYYGGIFDHYNDLTTNDCNKIQKALNKWLVSSKHLK